MTNIPLNQVPRTLGDLSFDEMELLRDFIKGQLGYKIIRHGLPPLDAVYLSPKLERVLELLPVRSRNSVGDHGICNTYRISRVPSGKIIEPSLTPDPSRLIGSECENERR